LCDGDSVGYRKVVSANPCGDNAETETRVHKRVCLQWSGW